MEGISAFIPLSGKLKENISPVSMELGDFVEAKNVSFDRLGEISSRAGALDISESPWTYISDSGSQIFGIFNAWKSDGKVSIIIRTPTKLSASDPDDEFFPDLWGEIKTGLSSGNIPYFCMAKDLAIMTDSGGFAPQKWGLDAATTSNLGGTPPTGLKFCVFHKNRLWGASGSTLYWSKDNDIENWTIASPLTAVSADSQPININDGDVITGISQSFFGDLYVFKGVKFGSIWRVSGSASTGNDKFKIEPVAMGGVACIDHNSIVTTPTDVFWLSQRGISSLVATNKYGDVSRGIISDEIIDTFNLADFTKLDEAHGDWFDAHHRLIYLIPMSDETRKFFVLNTANGQEKWSVNDLGSLDYTLTALKMGYTGGSSEKTLYLAVDDDDEFSEQIKEWQPRGATVADVGEGFVSSVKTGVLSTFKDIETGKVIGPEVKKRLHHVTLVYKTIVDNEAGNISVKVAADNNAAVTASFLNSNAVEGTKVVTLTKKIAVRDAYSFQVEVTWDNLSARFGAFAVILHLAALEEAGNR